MSLENTLEIKWREIRDMELLAQGSFGKVYKATCRNMQVVVKVLIDPTDPVSWDGFLSEVKIMSTRNHPNICLFMGVCSEPGRYCIIQELMEGGDVEKALEKHTYNLFDRMRMAYEASLGIQWLHHSNIIHRDIKTSNFVIDSHGTVKVCDFGLSMVVPYHKMIRDGDSAKGTPLYMPPEVLQFEPLNFKADVYSFGIVLWEFLTERKPFSNHSELETFKDAVCNLHERPEIPPNTEPSIVKLITSCWDANPQKRPSFERIVLDLQSILVDVAVSDPIGRLLWKTHFLGELKVPWTEFERALIITLNLPMNDPDFADSLKENIKCLRAVLTVNENMPTPREVVTLVNWGKILTWYGPIGDPKTTSPNTTFLNDINQLLKEKWFHGDISPDGASDLLHSQPDGTFLIRLSSQAGWFALCYSYQNTVYHSRISHIPGQAYIYDNTSYTSLYDIVVRRGHTLPCPGSKYQRLFSGGKSSMYQ